MPSAKDIAILDATIDVLGVNHRETLVSNDILVMYSRNNVLRDWHKMQKYYTWRNYGPSVTCLLLILLIAIYFLNPITILSSLIFVVLVVITICVGVHITYKFDKFKEYVAGEYYIYSNNFWNEVYGDTWKANISLYSFGPERGFRPENYVESEVYSRWLRHIKDYSEYSIFNRKTKFSKVGTRVNYSNIGEAQMDLAYYFLHNLVWDLRLNDSKRNIKQLVVDRLKSLPFVGNIF